MTENATSFVLLREEMFDELRVVTMQANESGDVAVTEQCDGEVTFQSFGSIHHVGSITISHANLHQVLSALHTTQDDLRTALASYFAGSRPYLCDLQDILDGAGISYEFVASDGNVTARRAP